MSKNAAAEDFRHLLEQPRDPLVAPRRGESPYRRTHNPPASILNVEDHAASRAERSRVIRARGYRVIEAESAAEALRVLTRRTISLALVDVHLPDSDGVALCETLKRLRQDVPVVLISAIPTAPEMRDSARAAGADHFLEEPIDRDGLLRCIDDALTRQADDGSSEVQVITDNLGFIVDTTPDGARLLNGTARGVQRRALLLYFEENRDAWRAALVRASAGERISLTGRLRPRDRRPLVVTVQIERAVEDRWAGVRWTFHRHAPSEGVVKNPSSPYRRTAKNRRAAGSGGASM